MQKKVDIFLGNFTRLWTLFKTSKDILRNTSKKKSGGHPQFIFLINILKVKAMRLERN